VKTDLAGRGVGGEIGGGVADVHTHGKSPLVAAACVSVSASGKADVSAGGVHGSASTENQDATVCLV